MQFGDWSETHSACEEHEARPPYASETDGPHSTDNRFIEIEKMMDDQLKCGESGLIRRDSENG
jgi:hypothetical protein